MRLRNVAIIVAIVMAIIICFEYNNFLLTTSKHLVSSASRGSQNGKCGFPFYSPKSKQIMSNISERRHSIYHIHKGKCENKYGSIALLQFTQGKNYVEGEVFNALQSMRCYAKMKGYHLYQFDAADGSLLNNIDFDAEHIVKTYTKCKTKHLLSLRHCVAAEMLLYYNYVIHIDADSGVVNPHHCFEEFINPKVDMHFLLRIHTGEIQAGHYIVKSTNFGKEFLKNWADSISEETNEQRSLHIHLSKHFLSANEDMKCQEHSSYDWKWINCITSTMRAKKRDHGKLLLYSRAQTFVRDGWASQYRWSKHDFMFHAMKRDNDVVFTRKLRHEDCENDIWVIPSKKELYVDVEQKMKDIWLDLDKKYFVPNTYAIDIGIAHCWPNCPHLIV